MPQRAFWAACILTISCVRPTMSKDGTTNLSDVTINFPTADKLPDMFGGPGCPDIKPPEAELLRLGTTDRCLAAAKLLESFKLTIGKNNCDPGVDWAEKFLTGKALSTKMGDKVNKGCKYNVLLEVGELSVGRVYYSNVITATGNLDVPKSAPSAMQLKVELSASPTGLTVGFPKSQNIQTETQSDLTIDVTLGKAPSPAPSTVVKFVDLNASVLSKKCVPCHISGGGDVNRRKFVNDETEFDMLEAEVLGRLVPGLANSMPPKDRTQLDEVERRMIRTYFE